MIVSGSVDCIIFPWFFNGDGEEGRDWRLPGLLYRGDLVLCGELEDLRVMVGHFVEKSSERQCR